MSIIFLLQLTVYIYITDDLVESTETANLVLLAVKLTIESTETVNFMLSQRDK